MHRFSLLLGERLLEEFSFDKENIAVGRHEHADICIANRVISRRHARIETRGETCHIIDLGATNGIVFNGEPVASRILARGDVVYLGKYGIRYDGAGQLSEADRATRNYQQLAGGMRAGQISQHGKADVIDAEESTVAVQFKGNARRLLGIKGEPLPGQACFAVTYDDGNEEQVNLASGSVTFGRSAEADIRLYGLWLPAVLGRLIYRRDRGAVLQCVRRCPKVRVNGQPSMRADLHDGDEITVGKTTIRVRIG